MTRERGSRGQRLLQAPDACAQKQAGCYVYCVAMADEEVGLGETGIEDSQAYTVVHNGLCAVVHDCPAKPYESRNAEMAAVWVLAHHRIVEAAWKRWGTVLPLTFNTIIAAGERNAQENLVAWLDDEYQMLRRKLEGLAGKAEYGVQVFWDASLISKKVAETSTEIRKLQEEMEFKLRGLAYMYRQKLEGVLKREIQARATESCEELYGRLSRCVDSIHVEKVKKGEEGQHMLMNLSCLVSTEKYPGMEAEVNRISRTEGYFARLAGPLPPYSFC